MQTVLLICLIVFLILLIYLERIKSIKIIIRLICSIGIIYGYIKAITEGKSIILYSSLLACSLILINVLIQNGIHKKTFVEIISIVLTTGITSSIVYIICSRFNLKIYQEEIMSFNGLKKTENTIFGIFMIASLGIFMDVISNIIVTLDGEKDKTIDVPWKEQYVKGIDVGKQYIREKINLIILSSLGSSLFLICMNINKINFFDIFKQDNIFVYCLTALLTNIGVVIAVIITSLLYSAFCRKKTIYKTTSENKVDGKRSLKL